MYYSMLNLLRLSPEEEVEFIKLATLWRKGKDFPIETCIFFNFGFDRELPYPQINLNPEEELLIAINTHGLQAPNGCTVVLIAGII